MNYNNTYPNLYGGDGNTANPLTWIKPCDSYGAPAAGSVVYCHADAAYLCTTCDMRVHVANLERVPMCESCERAPAAITCHADAAYLCTACDMLVHSANKLAGRHERVPILPLPFVFPENTNDGTMNAAKENNDEQDNETFYEEEMDEYLDMEELNSCYEYLGDTSHEEEEMMMMPSSHAMAVEAASTAEASTLTYSYTTGQMSHCVSFSSLEASVVPDSSAITEISTSHLTSPILAPTLQMHPDLSTDREARVMRYKEKKKIRKFKKTIRYASRKAHAEARPRVKGRFAKRSDIELDIDIEVDGMFSPASPSTLLDQN